MLEVEMLKRARALLVKIGLTDDPVQPISEPELHRRMHGDRLSPREKEYLSELLRKLKLLEPMA